MKLIKNLLIISLCLNLTQLAKGNDIFTNVKQKFKEDQISLNQFKYLGVLHCLDNRIGLEKEKLFVKEYIYLYNGLFPLPRLIKESSLTKIYLNFEKQYLSEKNNKENSIDICRELYNSNKLKNIYVESVSNRDNYYKENDEILFSKEDIKQNMLDYLNIGKIDQCRFLDCLPRKK